MECQDVSLVNSDEQEHALFEAEQRVLKIQTKLHGWARDDPHRRFDDLNNLVTDPAFLLVGWDRVRVNKGAARAGVDGRAATGRRHGEGQGALSADLNEPAVDVLLARLHPAGQGWCAISGRGVLGDLSYLRHYMWRTVWNWLRANTPNPPGSRSAAATSTANGGQPPRTRLCSTPPPARLTGTGIGEPRSRPLPDHRLSPSHDPTGPVESPVPGQQARRVREAARGNGAVERP